LYALKVPFCGGCGCLTVEICVEIDSFYMHTLTKIIGKFGEKYGFFLNIFKIRIFFVKLGE